MKIKKLMTIGYEGASVEDFLATLHAAGVTTLLDIREIAASRRKGFAKTALRTNFAGVGIAYRHEPRLGSPRLLGDHALLHRNTRRFKSGQIRTYDLGAGVMGAADHAGNFGGNQRVGTRRGAAGVHSPLPPQTSARSPPSGEPR